jgi:hypothetical protein
MAPQTDRLESEILALFKRACRQNRLDVAEHLLGALETLQQETGVHTHTPTQWALTEAYRELVHRH